VATIKTTGSGVNRRIVTKVAGGQRRVSCSCCPQDECCPYPANQLGVGYTQDDLPDEVLAPINADNLGLYTKNGSRFVGTFTSDEGTIPTEVIVAIQSGFTGWTWRAEGGPTFGGTFPCLFGQDELQTQDTFADTYTVSFLDKSVTVVRESLCFWRGEEEIDGFIYEADLFYNDTTFKWNAGFSTVDISSGSNEKDGTQNIPTGTYSGEYTIIVSA